MQSRDPSLRPTITMLAVLGALLTIRSQGARVTEWLSNPNTAALIGAITAIATVGLLIVTGVYAFLTYRIANGTLAAAEATRNAVGEAVRAREQAQQQFVQAAAPILAFTVDASGVEPFSLTHERFDLVVRNVGRGPALNLRIDASCTGFTYGLSARPPGPSDHLPSHRPNVPLILPLVLAAGEVIQLHVVSHGINADLVRRALANNNFGNIVATYGDVFGNKFSSSVVVRSEDPTVVSWDAGGVALDPL